MNVHQTNGNLENIVSHGKVDEPTPGMSKAICRIRAYNQQRIPAVF
jgi:hypothetical protein